MPPLHRAPSARCRFPLDQLKNSRRLLDAAAKQRRHDEAQRKIKRTQGLSKVREAENFRHKDTVLIFDELECRPFTDNLGTTPRGEIDDNMVHPARNDFCNDAFFLCDSGVTVETQRCG